MTKFSLDQTIFPQGSAQKRLTDLVAEGFEPEGPFFVKIKGGRYIIYEKVPDRDTVYYLANGDHYSTFITDKIKGRTKV